MPRGMAAYPLFGPLEEEPPSYQSTSTIERYQRDRFESRSFDSHPVHSTPNEPSTPPSFPDILPPGVDAMTRDAGNDLLMELFKARTEKNFEKVYKYFYPQWMRYFILNGVPGNQAEELAQDLAYAIWRGIDRFHGRNNNGKPCKIKTWVWAIIPKKLVNWRRSRAAKYQRGEVLGPLDGYPGAPQSPEGRTDARRSLAMIQKKADGDPLVAAAVVNRTSGVTYVQIAAERREKDPHTNDNTIRKDAGQAMNVIKLRLKKDSE